MAYVGAASAAVMRAVVQQKVPPQGGSPWLGGEAASLYRVILCALEQGYSQNLGQQGMFGLTGCTH
jgi:hypothetical protein